MVDIAKLESHGGKKVPKNAKASTSYEVGKASTPADRSSPQAAQKAQAAVDEVNMHNTAANYMKKIAPHKNMR